jgi:hypothetical protein
MEKNLDPAGVLTPTVQPVAIPTIDMCIWKDNIKVESKKEGVAEFVCHTTDQLRGHLNMSINIQVP